MKDNIKFDTLWNMFNKYEVANYICNFVHRVLLIIHERLLEQMFGIKEAHATSRLQQQNIIEEKCKKGRKPYAPSPRFVIRWLHQLLPNDLSEWAFIDIGSGLGRVVLEAARWNYAAIFGIEISEQLVTQARQNVYAIIRETTKRRRIHILHHDATRIRLPIIPCVIYFFNPFDRKSMEKFLDCIFDSYETCRRPLFLIYLNPVDDDLIASCKFLHPVSIPIGLRLRILLLSPFPVQIYATMECIIKHST